MTEKEKMQKQMLYNANYDKILLTERTKAKELCYQFNQLHPSDEKSNRRLYVNCSEKQKVLSV
ncbi:hypothetical protein HMPREF9943_01022 [Eggerthia catenaformis OT 569 = DSM 20559]|uniref:Maltose/galactoside acetyltransferase domain-containing protein n=1 Tax=Eggerthia catenaformis OT 569 = DSM 20559 TaxID=999415 RepID=M2NEQ0_9FIRM|nr:hypothetical protein HMPREF9943_01022 [Eggerthia catenaformis OT 569 = DSM 20559]